MTTATDPTPTPTTKRPRTVRTAIARPRWRPVAFLVGAGVSMLVGPLGGPPDGGPGGTPTGTSASQQGTAPGATTQGT